MATKLSRGIVFLVFFVIALVLYNSNATEKSEYMDTKRLSYFMSLKIIDDNKIKLVLFEHSVPAILHYNTPEEREFVLNTGESVSIYVDRKKERKTIFEFVGIEKEKVLFRKSTIEGGKTAFTSKKQVYPYPNRRNLDKKNEFDFFDDETKKKFITAFLSANQPEKVDTSYRDSEGLSFFYSVQIVDDQKIHFKMANSFYSEMVDSNHQGDFSFYLNKDESKKLTLSENSEKTITFEFSFKGIDDGKILIKEDMYFYDTKAGVNYYRFKPYTVDKKKILLFNLANYWQ